jgi:hypothetical protein
MFWMLDLLPSSDEEREGEGGVTKPTQLGPLERPSFLHLRMEADPASETLCFLSFLVFVSILY